MDFKDVQVLADLQTEKAKIKSQISKWAEALAGIEPTGYITAQIPGTHLQIPMHHDTVIGLQEQLNQAVVFIDQQINKIDTNTKQLNPNAGKQKPAEPAQITKPVKKTSKKADRIK